MVARTKQAVAAIEYCIEFGMILRDSINASLVRQLRLQYKPYMEISQIPREQGDSILSFVQNKYTASNIVNRALIGNKNPRWGKVYQGLLEEEINQELIDKIKKENAVRSYEKSQKMGEGLISLVKKMLREQEENGRLQED